MPFRRCATVADADAALATVRAQQGEAVFLFFGGEDPGTGISWCPDCVIADPVLRRTLAQARPDLAIYECPIATRADWKGGEPHPYRVHPAFRLARIPTAIRYVGGIEVARLVEGPCGDPAQVTAFVR
jgi:hypothetical protein